MAMTTLGDLAQAFTLRRQNVALKSMLQRLSTEITTGVTSDPARALRGDFVPLAALDASLARLQAYKTATSEAALFAGGMQTALDSVSSMAAKLGPSLLTAANSGHLAEVDGVGVEALQAFESAVAAFNTRLGDRSLFAGIATDRPALTDADTLLSALEAATAGASTAAEVTAAVDGWFAAPGGYTGSAYLGAGPLAPLAVAEGEVATLDTTAADPAIRDTLKGLALAALLDRNVLAGNTAERAALAEEAGKALMETATGRAQLAARIGSAEGRIEAAATRNTAEASALEIARAGLVSVDPYETAAALTDAQTRLETLYTLTARLTRLNLADYLT